VAPFDYLWILLYSSHSFIVVFMEFERDQHSFRPEIEPYIQLFSHVCPEDQKEDFDALITTLYMETNDHKNFFQFLTAFHKACRSMDDFRRLCRIGRQFTDVWRGSNILNFMTTMVAARVFHRDENGTMTAGGGTISKLECLVDFLIDPHFVEWYLKSLDGLSIEDEYRKFFDGANTFMDLMDWIYNTVSTQPFILKIFVNLWKHSGFETCQQFAKIYKHFARDGYQLHEVKYAAEMMKLGYPIVTEKYLKLVTEQNLFGDEVFRIYDEAVTFLENKNEADAIRFLDSQRDSV